LVVNVIRLDVEPPVRPKCSPVPGHAVVVSFDLVVVAKVAVPRSANEK
jgi:hypothetical protein